MAEPKSYIGPGGMTGSMTEKKRDMDRRWILYRRIIGGFNLHIGGF